MKALTEIESLIANRQLDDAEAALEDFLAKVPDDVEARMLLGICGQLKGDADCFCEVYRELAPSLDARAKAGEESPVIARWRQYLRVASYLMTLGIITLTGTGLAAPTSGLFKIDNAPALAEVESIRKTLNADEMKNLPRGVQNIKYDDKGVISTLVTVGKTAVPKALRKNPGRAAQYGGEKARDNAQLEFTRFLSTKCKWGKTADGETAVKEESASATGAQGNETSAESSSFSETEMTKDQKAQSAQACISGIQVLWEGMNDSGEYTWVGAWNAKALNSIKGMSQKMNEANAEVDDMGGRPMKKYAMGGLPMTKYAMGGRQFDDDDFL